jgi:hypothetical protein
MNFDKVRGITGGSSKEGPQVLCKLSLEAME